MRRRMLPPGLDGYTVCFESYEFTTSDGDPLFLSAAAQIMAAEGLGESDGESVTRIHVQLGHDGYGGGAGLLKTWDVKGTPDDVRLVSKALYDKMSAEAARVEQAYQAAIGVPGTAAHPFATIGAE